MKKSEYLLHIYGITACVDIGAEGGLTEGKTFLLSVSNEQPKVQDRGGEETQEAEVVLNML